MASVSADSNTAQALLPKPKFDLSLAGRVRYHSRLQREDFIDLDRNPNAQASESLSVVLVSKPFSSVTIQLPDPPPSPSALKREYPRTHETKLFDILGGRSGTKLRLHEISISDNAPKDDFPIYSPYYKVSLLEQLDGTHPLHRNEIQKRDDSEDSNDESADESSEDSSYDSTDEWSDEWSGEEVEVKIGIEKDGEEENGEVGEVEEGEERKEEAQVIEGKGLAEGEETTKKGVEGDGKELSEKMEDVKKEEDAKSLKEKLEQLEGEPTVKARKDKPDDEVPEKKEDSNGSDDKLSTESPGGWDDKDGKMTEEEWAEWEEQLRRWELELGEGWEELVRKKMQRRRRDRWAGSRLRDCDTRINDFGLITKPVQHTQPVRAMPPGQSLILYFFSRGIDLALLGDLDPGFLFGGAQASWNRWVRVPRGGWEAGMGEGSKWREGVIDGRINVPFHWEMDDGFVRGLVEAFTIKRQQGEDDEAVIEFMRQERGRKVQLFGMRVVEKYLWYRLTSTWIHGDLPV